MENRFKKLPEAELDIMMTLWEAEGPVPRSYFDVALKESKNWADSTILSLLSRLMEKGFISAEKQGNRNFYTPLVPKAEYLAFENSSFLSRLHKNSLRNLVVSMADSHDLKAEEIDELQALLDSLKKEGS